MQTHDFSNPLTATIAVGSGDLLGVMVSMVFVVVSLALLVRGWSAKRLRQRTLVVLALALAVNVLHLVDMWRESRGETSMRQYLWPRLQQQRKMTSEQNESLPDSPPKCNTPRTAATNCQRSIRKNSQP